METVQERVFGVPVQDLVKQAQVIRRINGNSLARAVYHSIPDKCLTRIISTCLALPENKVAAPKRAKALFNLFDFDFTYGPADKGSWSTRP